MPSIKILPKTFSGGSLKQLPDLMRGLAIDNARVTFAQMDLQKLTLDNQIKGVLPFILTHIPLPEKGDRDHEIPETFWNMAGDAVEAMQLIASKVNVVLDRFGLEEISNAGGTGHQVNEIKMDFSDETVVVAGENFGGQLRYLRDSLGALGNRVSDILVALGGERLKGNTGGSPKCNQIYPAIETRNGNYPVSLEELEVFLNDFNMDLSFIVSEWNLLVGVGEPGLELVTSVTFDEGIMTIPEIKTTQYAGEEVGQAPSNIEWVDAVTDLKHKVSILEVWTETLAETYAFPYTGQIPLRLGDPPENINKVEIKPSDIPHYDQGGTMTGVVANEVYGELTLIFDALQLMLTPINHALAMSGNTTIMDLVTNSAEPAVLMELSCEEIAEVLRTLDKSVACLGKAIETITSVQVSTASQSLKVIAG